MTYRVPAFEATSTHHKRADAPLRRFPFEAAVDVIAGVDEEHDAAPHSVEVAQQQLQSRWDTRMEHEHRGSIVNKDQ